MSSDWLSIYPALAVQVGIEAACIHAALRQDFPEEREAMANLDDLTSSLQASLPFLTPVQVMAGLSGLVECDLLAMGDGTGGITPIRVLSCDKTGDAGETGATAVEPPSSMTLNWTPPPHVAQVLHSYGVAESFWTDQLGQFRVYWMERGGNRRWGSTFIGWVRRGWEQSQATLAAAPQQEMDVTDWQPSEELCVSLEQGNITAGFPRAQLQRFKTEMPSRWSGDAQRLDELFSRFVRDEWAMQQLKYDDRDPAAQRPAVRPLNAVLETDSGDLHES